MQRMTIQCGIMCSPQLPWEEVIMLYTLSTATQLDRRMVWGVPAPPPPPPTNPVAQATDGGRTRGGSLDLGNMNLLLLDHETLRNWLTVPMLFHLQRG